MTENESQEAWKEALRAQLQALPVEERFVAAGELITWITYKLLPDLGAMRRDCIVDLVDLHLWEVMKMKDHFGMSRSAIVRLLDEGRADRKYQRAKRDAQAVLEPTETA